VFSIESSCGCGCQQTLAPQPSSPKRCLAAVTPIAELVYLSGLDADNCYSFQRLVDVLHLRDCAGNRISAETPVVVCSDFKDQLCAAIAALASGGTADEATLLVGADCKLYTLPNTVPGIETPNSVVDTNSIDFSATGTLNRTISGNVKLSADAGNQVSIHADGLFVPAPSAPLSACAQIGAFGFGADAVPGTVLIGADCLKHTLAAPDSVSVTDTDTVDLTLTGQNIQADVIIDPQFGNALIATGNGLLVSCSSVLACAPPVTVLDTYSVDLTLVGQQLSADVRISPDSGNAVEVRPNGLFVDVCAALDDGNAPVPATPGVTPLVGSDCNRYTVPLQTPLLVVDSSSVNLSINPTVQQTLQADVILAPNQLIQNLAQGLSLTCEQVQDCVFTITNNFWTYNDAANSVQFNPSSDTGNQITTGSDGRPFVAASPLAVADTPCLNLTLAANVISGVPTISPDAGNLIQCTGNGLFVFPTQVSITGTDTDCFQVTASEPTENNFEIAVTPIISPAPGNTLSCTAAGLYAASSDFIITPAPSCTSSVPQVGTMIVGADGSGLPEWQRIRWNRTMASAGGAITQAALIAAGWKDKVLVTAGPAGSVTIEPPTDECGIHEIWIKNVDASNVLTVSSSGAETIDGVASITLDPALGGYPFGNNGGEAAHIIWDIVTAAWYIV
jgi:hypothetical protein